MQIQTILVPVDFSDHSQAAFDSAVELAQKFNSKLHLLHCYHLIPAGVPPYGVALPDSFYRDCRDRAVEELAKWEQKASSAGLKVSASVAATSPGEAIPREAEAIGADLIVMGTRGLTGLKHVVLGSVAERTLRAAHCPVLTIRRPTTD